MLLNVMVTAPVPGQLGNSVPKKFAPLQYHGCEAAAVLSAGGPKVPGYVSQFHLNGKPS